MAGLYVDVPGHRMSYDIDGSVGFTTNRTSSTTALTNGDLVTINSESSTGITVANGLSTGILFPELRDIDGALYTHGGASSAASFQTSADTTNGLDGTWTTVHTTSSFTTYSGIQFRTNISSFTSNGVIAIRATKSTGGDQVVRGFHIYGDIASGQTPDRLRFWHPTLDQEVGAAYFDFAEVGRGLTSTKQFRIKNNSASLTANTITISREALTDGGTQTTVAALQFSDDDISYGNTESITSLSAGSISSIFYVKYAPTTSATFGLRWARFRAIANSWS